MSEKRLLEVCKALFAQLLTHCWDDQDEYDVYNEIGLSYKEYKELGGRLTLKELMEIERGEPLGCGSDE